MTETQLIQSCTAPSQGRRLNWVSEVYGFGTLLRKFGFYPSRFPLNIYISHGVAMQDQPATHEINNKAAAMIFFSSHLVDAFRKLSSKPCYCVISPNVFYRRHYKVQQDNNAKGTLAFLAHTTPKIEDKMDFRLYAEQLKRLPAQYQPVTICLHYHDVNKGLQNLFYEAGLDVVTVGHPYHKDFIRKFYDLIKQFRYTTSNEVGSYTFYSVEMSIPFFLYGIEPELYNLGDINIELGRYMSYRNATRYQQAKQLFSTPVDNVTPSQRLFAEKLLGVYDSVSRFKFSFILHRAYFTYLLKKLIRVISSFLKASNAKKVAKTT